MPTAWPSTTLSDPEDALGVLTELRGKRWLCRGQSQVYGALKPSIDRGPMEKLSRQKKLSLERQSIDIFRSTGRFFAAEGERLALTDDVVALMVLRHYGTPTRLLDWSLSPYVAAYFAVHSHDSENGEIWAFDHDRYVTQGTKQWRTWPQTTLGGSKKGKDFRVELTAFAVEQPPDWFVCNFYRSIGGFPRQDSQDGAYSMTARFARDHADAIAHLLKRPSYYHRYVIRASLKKRLLKRLREKHGIWRGSLFPDSAGAAETARTTVFPSG